MSIFNRWKLQFHVDRSVEEIAHKFNPKIRGWLNYYGKFYLSRLFKLANYIDMAIRGWLMRKYKKLKGKYCRAKEWLRRYLLKRPHLFPHWQYSLKQWAR